MSSEGGLLAPWLLYFPRLAQTWTQGADRDLANSKRLQATIVGFVLHFYLGTTGKGQLKERAVSEGLSFPLSLSFLSAFAFSSVSVALLPLLISPCLPVLALPCLLSLFLFSFPLVSSLAFFSLEPCLAHLPAPTSCAILVLCSGLGQGQTWQNWWIPVEAAEPLGSHPIPSSRGCTGE